MRYGIEYDVAFPNLFGKLLCPARIKSVRLYPRNIAVSSRGCCHICAERTQLLTQKLSYPTVSDNHTSALVERERCVCHCALNRALCGRNGVHNLKFGAHGIIGKSKSRFCAQTPERLACLSAENHAGFVRRAA